MEVSKDSSPGFFPDLIAREQQSSAVRRGVIYARYSTDMQDTSESIEVQITECQKYATDHDILITREPFVDRAESGGHTENRKAYQSLLALAHSSGRDFEVILTFHTSRWGRGIESEIDEHRLQTTGVKIIAVSQPFTAAEDVESAFMKGVLRKIDAYYSMQASKYTHAYQTSNARHGFKNGGIAPDGYIIEQVPTGKRDKYDVEKMKARLALDVNPGRFDSTSQARYKLVEYAFAQAYQGRGVRSIAKAIREQGWQNRHRPEPISHITIRNWLINPLYTGFMVWNRVRFYRKNGKRTYTPNPVSKWVCSEQPVHAAIVSKDIFESVARRYLSRRSRLGNKKSESLERAGTDLDNRGRYLLSGLLYCGSCGAHYVAAKNMHSGKKTHVYYLCNTKWKRGRLDCAGPNINLAVAEGATLDALLNTILTDGEIRRFIDAFNKFIGNRAADSEKSLARIDEERARIRLELDRIKRAILSGADPTALADDLNERHTRLGALQVERESISGSGGVETISYDPARFNIWLEMLKRNFKSMDFETRRELTRTFIARIDVGLDRTAQLRWNPEAILRLADGPRVPRTATMVMKELCGGTTHPNHPCPRPIIMLNLKVQGKARWPFGWNILSDLAGSEGAASQ
jgi:DNA invertase Pin-like site-specific DNA recombinase